MSKLINNENKRMIVEFSHPGKEYIPYKRKDDPNVLFNNKSRNIGKRKWNNLHSHKRKFMKSHGNYLSSNNILFKTEPLTFWGEWEAESYFERINTTESPQFIHSPFLDIGYNGPTKHNTDPFVFGERFWYTNCKQGKKDRKSFLRNLSKNSIILFGTESKYGFKLDTVFVVKDKFDCLQIQSKIETFSEQFKKTNLFLNNMLFDENKSHYSYYAGKNYNDDKDLFSFSPSKVVKDQIVESHERVILDVKQFGLQKIGAGSVCTRLFLEKLNNNNLDDNFLYDYWKKIAKTCFDQGFVLGFNFELPKIM